MLIGRKISLDGILEEKLELTIFGQQYLVSKMEIGTSIESDTLKEKIPKIEDAKEAAKAWQTLAKMYANEVPEAIIEKLNFGALVTMVQELSNFHTKVGLVESGSKNAKGAKVN
jgi:hypothetical protein